MANYARTEYWGGAALIPEIESCGRSAQHAARPGLMMHRHRRAFEITLVNQGQVEWVIADRIVVVSAGDVILTKPGEWHGSAESIVHPCELYWFRVIDGAHPAIADLLADLAVVEARHVTASPVLAHCVRSVLFEHQQRGPHAVVAVRALIHQALVAVVREAAAPGQSVSTPVQAALDWMADHIGDAYTVADVAAAVNLSLVRLEARFADELHCSIGEHRSRSRVRQAKALLADTEAEITAIAHKLAFSSSQYFATVFRQRVGVTPSQYRAQARAGHGSSKMPAGSDSDDKTSAKRAMRDKLASEVRRLFAKYQGSVGPRDITAELRQTGWRVGEATVAREMRAQRLAVVTKRPPAASA